MNEAKQQRGYALDEPGSAGPATIRNSLVFAATIVVLTSIVIAFGGIQLAYFPRFTIFHAVFVFVVDAVTAVLLYGQFAYRRLPSYCILASAFLFSAFVVIPFLLSFPGALKVGEEVIGGDQSAIWVWHVWHTLFPAIVGLSLVLQARGANRPIPRDRVARSIVMTVTAVLLLVVLVTVAVTLFHDRLPVLIIGERLPFNGNFYWAGGIATTVTAAAFVLALWLARQRTNLHVWLAMVLLALLGDEAASLSGYPRYSLAWYFGRIEWMLAASVLLVVFVTEINRLYQRLGDAMHELFDANRTLSTVVEEKDALLVELRESDTHLREADQRKDAFLATLAHELRNPLAPVGNAARLLARKPEREVVEWATGVIERQVAHMARLLEDLLDISRIKRNRLELRRARISLREILEAACEQSRPLLEEAKQELLLDIPSEPICLDGDKARLAQVFANLLNNAARYTLGPGKVTVVAKREGGNAIVHVRDCGIGIEPEMLDSVFDMFYQLPSADRRRNGGVGIGLALVKGLVELHGGAVTAQSAGAGKGSEFIVRLPTLAETPAVPPMSAVPPEAARAERSLRILVVDDNHDNADSMRALLEILGHQPGVAYRAREALALGPEFRPAVVLLDIGLPDMTGYECAGLIRKTDWGRDVLLIAMTGWGKIEDKQRAFAAGFDEHLTKPVDLDRLEKILSERTEALA